MSHTVLCCNILYIQENKHSIFFDYTSSLSIEKSYLSILYKATINLYCGYTIILICIYETFNGQHLLYYAL